MCIFFKPDNITKTEILVSVRIPHQAPVTDFRLENQGNLNQNPATKSKLRVLSFNVCMLAAFSVFSFKNGPVILVISGHIKSNIQ